MTSIVRVCESAIIPLWIQILMGFILISIFILLIITGVALLKKSKREKPKEKDKFQLIDWILLIFANIAIFMLLYAIIKEVFFN